MRKGGSARKVEREKGKGQYLPRAELLVNDDLTARVNLLLPLLDGLLDNLPRRQPRLVKVIQPAQKLAARELTRLQEPFKEDLVVELFVPPGVESTDARGEVRAGTVAGGTVVLGDAVVVGVDCFDKVGVHLEVEGVDDGGGGGLLSDMGDDIATEVPVRWRQKA